MTARYCRAGLTCPECGAPVEDEGLCVRCWDAWVEVDEDRKARDRAYILGWRERNWEHVRAYERAYRAQTHVRAWYVAYKAVWRRRPEVMQRQNRLHREWCARRRLQHAF